MSMCLAAVILACYVLDLDSILSCASLIGEDSSLIRCICTHSTRRYFRNVLPFAMCPFHSELPDWCIPGTRPAYENILSSKGESGYVTNLRRYGKGTIITYAGYGKYEWCLGLDSTSFLMILSSPYISWFRDSRSLTKAFRTQLAGLRSFSVFLLKSLKSMPTL